MNNQLTAFETLKNQFKNLDGGSFDLGWEEAKKNLIKILESNEIAYQELYAGGQIEEIEKL